MKGRNVKPQINPAWLVSLMCQWVLRTTAGEAKALGYPKKACGFSEKTTGGYNHSDPTAFGVVDYTDLELSLEQLKADHPMQYLTMMMYYKPWTVRAMVEEGFAFNNSTYYKRLHAGHQKVADCMQTLLRNRQPKAA